MSRGRPKIEINWELVERLAAIFCTEEEIATVLGVGINTLKRRKEFWTIYKKGREHAKMALRRYQFKLASKNPTMAIWLGKQYLGQKEMAENFENNKLIDGVEFVELK